MPRANRYITQGRFYHVTHRCHDRSFLLKFVRDRNLYRSMLRERLPKYELSLLGYCLTSNHVHLLLQAGQRDAVAGLMHSLAGDFARAYNLRKGRRNAFWGERYHATLVDGTTYLWRCLRYIDMNMVRAGVVTHPREWAWCGYHELVGLRRRYCLIDQEKLLRALGDGWTPERFENAYYSDIEERLRLRDHARNGQWTESLAVGSQAFVERISSTIKNRSRVGIEHAVGEESGWVLKETRPDYS
jgi:putative transposase